MKPEELRIGNLVHDPNVGMVKIESLSKHGIGYDLDPPVKYEDKEIDYLTCYAEDWLKPIPLTEEWVRRLSSTKPKIYLRHIDDQNRHNYTEDKHPSRWIYEVCIQPDLTDNEGYAIRFEIKYVHQWQNIYFALTGEELTLKDEIPTS